MTITVRTLSQFSLFAGLKDSALRKIISYVEEFTLEPEQAVVLAGGPCEGVCLVARGVMRARRLSLNGREYVLSYMGPGEFFNLVPVLDGGPSLFTVEALTYATVYLIPCAYFDQIVQDYHEVALAVLERLAGRVRYLSDTVEELALHTVRTRLARFLLSRVSDYGRDSEPTNHSRHWTQQEIASHIGSVRDVVGRTLRSFSREGWVRRERGRLVITDREGLEHEAMRQ
jgi:CRP/FNR family transcriptional regulator